MSTRRSTRSKTSARSKLWLIGFLSTALFACSDPQAPNPDGPDESSVGQTFGSLNACRKLVQGGLRTVPDDRADRFLGKVQPATALCRGGDRAVARAALNLPWVDWQSYWGAGDKNSRNINYDGSWFKRFLGKLFEAGHVSPNMRGIDGALIDLEFARVELIKFNLFDNSTYRDYVQGRGDEPGSTLTVWPQMRLPSDHPQFQAVGGAAEQVCTGELIRHRSLSGICNDTQNPLMGSSNMPFARNVQFEETFPDMALNELTAARHGGRIALLQPDPQLISRKLFTRHQSVSESGVDLCNKGQGMPGESKAAHCDYQKAPFFNVLAAFWIQFMTHDWFSHLREGNNQLTALQSAGCDSKQALAAGCRPNDQYHSALVRDESPPSSFEHAGKQYQARARKTFDNTVTAWWDASQIYGYDEVSATRVKRDGARLLMDETGYLSRFAAPCAAGEGSGTCDNIQPQWQGQEWSAFPDNWTLGMTFYHNVFAREHNAFVDAFLDTAKATPNADCGLRNPAFPDRVITYSSITADELFEAARLVVAAEIAKIHTIEWTTQLLYNDPLYRGMNSNWSGLFDGKGKMVNAALAKVVRDLKESDQHKRANSWYSVLAAGPGIVGTGNSIIKDGKDVWTLRNNEHINGGSNHFGSPFNFPEEFTTVYRLHPLVPDLLELRALDDPNRITRKVPAVKAFRGAASDILQRAGIANWALSMGRQRLGLLHLNNHGSFLQNLPMPHLQSASQTLDIAALDIIRDRERGVPRFNEFRRQYGMAQLTGFSDFVNPLPDVSSAERQRQETMVEAMREVYGQHRCDASKIISHAQRLPDGSYPDDCLGHADGSMVDNIEDLDTVVGWLAEPVRPHGYAISETQFVVFILNASRRLFSDRFFTSSFRPEFYTAMGHAWVMNNGPRALLEKSAHNGHQQAVAPMKRVLQRTVPELAEELEHVVNVFDPWARDRGEYYSLEWKPREDAKDDESFQR
jgi:hypothetical protein